MFIKNMNHYRIKRYRFTINQGETVAIVGSSGAGKSVCLRNMVRLTGPDSGSVIIDGLSLENLSEEK